MQVFKREEEDFLVVVRDDGPPFSTAGPIKGAKHALEGDVTFWFYNADMMLLNNGYARTASWHSLEGQWVAEVEEVEAIQPAPVTA